MFDMFLNMLVKVGVPEVTYQGASLGNDGAPEVIIPRYRVLG